MMLPDVNILIYAFRADLAQHPDARRQREPVVFDDCVEFPEERRGFLIGQIELHTLALCHDDRHSGCADIRLASAGVIGSGPDAPRVGLDSTS